MIKPDENSQLWDLWEVDDVHRWFKAIKTDGLRGEMLKEADRLNESHDHSDGNCVRYIALPVGEEPVFNSIVPPQAPPPVQNSPAQKPRITHQWVCDLQESMPGTRCTPVQPHGLGFNCGYWHLVEMPSNLITDDLMRLAMKLFRIGALTNGNINRRPPAY